LLPIWAISPGYWSVPLHMHGDKNSGSGEKIKHMGIIIADLAPFSHSRSNKCARARRERFWIQLIIDRRRCSQPDHVASWASDGRMRTQGKESASGTFTWLGSLESPDGQLETTLLIEIDEYMHTFGIHRKPGAHPRSRWWPAAAQQCDSIQSTMCVHGWNSWVAMNVLGSRLCSIARGMPVGGGRIRRPVPVAMFLLHEKRK